MHDPCEVPSRENIGEARIGNARRTLELVRKVIHFKQNLRIMKRIDASLRKASALRDRFSKSLDSLRLRLLYLSFSHHISQRIR